LYCAAVLIYSSKRNPPRNQHKSGDSCRENREQIKRAAKPVKHRKSNCGPTREWIQRDKNTTPKDFTDQLQQFASGKTEMDQVSLIPVSEMTQFEEASKIKHDHRWGEGTRYSKIVHRYSNLKNKFVQKKGGKRREAEERSRDYN
jgi:hypothetical protein